MGLTEKDLLRKIDLQWTIDECNAKLQEIKDRERRIQGEAMIGKCFRYRNSASCAESEEDYWWLYIRVISMLDNNFVFQSFETDKDNQISINLHSYSLHGWWVHQSDEIPESLYIEELIKVQHQIADEMEGAEK